MHLTFSDSDSKSTHFSKEVIGGGPVIVPHSHLQCLFLQLERESTEAEGGTEMIMSDLL